MPCSVTESQVEDASPVAMRLSSVLTFSNKSACPATPLHSNPCMMYAICFKQPGVQEPEQQQCTTPALGAHLPQRVGPQLCFCLPKAVTKGVALLHLQALRMGQPRVLVVHSISPRVLHACGLAKAGL